MGRHLITRFYDKIGEGNYKRKDIGVLLPNVIGYKEDSRIYVAKIDKERGVLNEVNQERTFTFKNRFDENLFKLIIDDIHKVRMDQTDVPLLISGIKDIDTTSDNKDKYQFVDGATATKEGDIYANNGLYIGSADLVTLDAAMRPVVDKSKAVHRFTAINYTTDVPIQANNKVTIEKTLNVKKKSTLEDELEVYKKTTLDDVLEVVKKATFDDVLEVVKKATFDDELEIVKQATLDDNLLVKKDTHIEGDLTVDGETNLSGAANLDGDVTIEGWLHVKKQLEVDKETTLRDTLKVVKKATFDDEIEVTKGTVLLDTLSVAKKTTLQDELEVSKKATFLDEVLIKKATRIDSSLDTYDGNVYFHGKLDDYAENQSVISFLDSAKHSGTDPEPIYVFTDSLSKFKANMELSGNLTMDVDDTYSIGTASKKHKDIYAHTFHGDFNGNADTATKLKTTRNLKFTGIKNTSVDHDFDGTSDLTFDMSQLEFNAEKITDGIIDIDRLPKTALERLVPVENETAMKLLTIDDVQNGDTVQNLETGVMYLVIDDSQLGGETPIMAFRKYTAGNVVWTNVQEKPAWVTDPKTFTITYESTLEADQDTVTYNTKDQKSINFKELYVHLPGGLHDNESKTYYNTKNSKSISITPSSIGAAPEEGSTDINQLGSTINLGEKNGSNYPDTSYIIGPGMTTNRMIQIINTDNIIEDKGNLEYVFRVIGDGLNAPLMSLYMDSNNKGVLEVDKIIGAAISGTAESADKLKSDAGENDNFIYFNNGVPVASDLSKGANDTPIYINNGKICASSLDFGSDIAVAMVNGKFTKITSKGSSKKPIYIASDGTITEFSETVGSATKPMYLKDGVLTEGSKDFSDYLPLAGGTMTGDIKFGSDIFIGNRFTNKLMFGGANEYKFSLPNSVATISEADNESVLNIDKITTRTIDAEEISADKLVIPVVASDPSDPEVGQMWINTSV